MMKYCGAHYWLEDRAGLRGTPLRDRLYRYSGTTIYNNLLYHLFKGKMGNMMLTDHQLMKNLGVFKPFILDMEELGIKEKDEYAP